MFGDGNSIWREGAFIHEARGKRQEPLLAETSAARAEDLSRAPWARSDRIELPRLVWMDTVWWGMKRRRGESWQEVVHRDEKSIGQGFTDR